MHRLEIRGDVLVIIASGVMDEEASAKAVELGKAILQQHSHYFVLCNATKMTGFSAQARRIIGTWKHFDRCGGCVTFGAGAVVKTLISLVLRGMALLSKASVPVLFVDTEQAAWAWLSQQRAAVGARRLDAGTE